MKNLWIKFGCYLTGFNYTVLQECSEVSKQFVKRMTAALVVIFLVWSLIGFYFSSRYLQLSVAGSIVGAVVMLVIVLQIERQILLSVKVHTAAFVIRLVLGFIVAVLGATIIDQVFLKSDLDLQKKALIILQLTADKHYVDSVTNQHLHQTDSSIHYLMADIIAHPKMQSYTNEKFDSTTKQYTTSISYIANPNAALVDTLQKQKSALFQKLEADQRRFDDTVGVVHSQPLKDNAGFLEELNLMYAIVSNSHIALAVYSLWFLFFVLIETFIVVAKAGGGHNDYDELILYQQSVRVARLRQMAQGGTNQMAEPRQVKPTNGTVKTLP